MPSFKYRDPTTGQWITVTGGSGSGSGTSAAEIPVTSEPGDDVDIWIDPNEEDTEAYLNVGVADERYASSVHASRHASGGEDEITPAAIGAYTQEEVDALLATKQETIDTLVAELQKRPNPNLLDNWYWVNPVNQRGATEYTAAGYTIDRWYISSNAESVSVSVESGGIGVSGSGGTYTNFSQKIEMLPAGTYTISFLVDDFSKVKQVYSNAAGTSSSGFSGNLCSHTFTLGGDAASAVIGIQPVDGAGKLLVKAAKLELGTQQTLAHQDTDGNWVLNEIPDYGEQLAKCQRCFVMMKNSNTTNKTLLGHAFASTTGLANTIVELPVSMRAIPAITYAGLEYSTDISSAAVAVTSVAGVVSGSTNHQKAINIGGTFTAKQMYTIWLAVDGYIAFDANL